MSISYKKNKKMAKFPNQMKRWLVYIFYGKYKVGEQKNVYYFDIFYRILFYRKCKDVENVLYKM